MGLIRKIALGSVVAFGIYSFRKYKRTVTAINNLLVSIDKIHNVKVDWDKIQLQIDLKLSNPTAIALGVTTFGVVKIKQIQFYSIATGSLIGTANVNISNIDIKPNNHIIIKNIPAVIPITSALNNIDLFLGKGTDSLKVILIIESFGKQLKLNTE